MHSTSLPASQMVKRHEENSEKIPWLSQWQINMRDGGCNKKKKKKIFYDFGEYINPANGSCPRLSVHAGSLAPFSWKAANCTFAALLFCACRIFGLVSQTIMGRAMCRWLNSSNSEYFFLTYFMAWPITWNIWILASHVFHWYGAVRGSQLSDWSGTLIIFLKILRTYPKNILKTQWTPL